MSNELYIPNLATGSAPGAILWGQNRATRWNGTAMVAAGAIASSGWSTGVIPLAELQTSDSLGTGRYVGSFPGGITAAGEYEAEFFATTAVTLGMPNIGTQLVPWDGTQLVTPALLESLIDQVNQVWTSAMTESYAANGAPLTPVQALHMIYAVCAQFGVSGTSIVARKLDGATTALTFTIDSATAPTERTRTS